jgi:biopolymer transport protein ExbD
MAMISGQRAQINVTPMIDVLLVLLIIFMVIVPQRSTGFDANVPQPPSGEPPNTHPKEIVVSVRADHSLDINTQSVAWDDLAERLRAIFATRVSPVLFVAGAPGIEFQEIARVIDIARGAGVARVALMPRDRPD